tara:strand:+ start:3051 stop:3599 length:549 start_codon:yes stop_codon:yes gene_type:complete
VWNSGKSINLADYNAACKDVDADEVFGLDVIQNPEGTRRNLEKQWEAGIDAIPTFHCGSDWKYLKWACQRPKIAVGSRMKRKAQWLREVFRRIHPKKVHGFAMSSRKALDTVPFHSVDATSWILGPQALGLWAGFTGRQIYLGSRGASTKDVWAEVLEYKRRATYAKARWAKAFEAMEARDA